MVREMVQTSAKTHALAIKADWSSLHMLDLQIQAEEHAAGSDPSPTMLDHGRMEYSIPEFCAPMAIPQNFTPLSMCMDPNKAWSGCSCCHSLAE